MAKKTGHHPGAEHGPDHEHEGPIDWEAYYETLPAEPTDWEYVDPLLPRFVAGPGSGRALELGCGTGSNAIWLSQQGWETTGVDVSAAAIKRAHALAKRANASLEFRAVDGASGDLGGPYDLITMFYIHVPSEVRRKIFANATSALADGGKLIYFGHDPTDSNFAATHPVDPDVMSPLDAVRSDLEAVLTVEDSQQVTSPLNMGDGDKDFGALVIVCRKPLDKVSSE